MRPTVRPVRTPGRYRQDRRTFRSTPHTPDRATDRAPGTDIRILRSEANERPKKTKGSHKQPLWNSSRKIPIPKQPAERPEHSAEGDRNAGFTHVRAYAVASISLGTTGPAAIPEQNPERPEHGGDYARRRNETEKGKRPDRSRERTALEEYDEYEQKKEPCIAARLLKEAATYSPTCYCSTIGVNGLNFPFRNRKGELRCYNHLNLYCYTYNIIQTQRYL